MQRNIPVDLAIIYRYQYSVSSMALMDPDSSSSRNDMSRSSSSSMESLDLALVAPGSIFSRTSMPSSRSMESLISVVSHSSPSQSEVSSSSSLESLGLVLPESTSSDVSRCSSMESLASFFESTTCCSSEHEDIDLNDESDKDSANDVEQMSSDELHLESPLYEGSDVSVLDSIILLVQFLLR